MEHPYAEIPKSEVVEMAIAFLPLDGTDWKTKCADAINWLNDRATEEGVDDGDWFMWRASDPVHVASLAFDGMGFSYTVGLRDITETPSPAYEAGVRAGWGKLLAELHRRRMNQYLAKKKQSLATGGEQHDG
jgi:hypothetical protein